jgi:predicted Zn-dependent protease
MIFAVAGTLFGFVLGYMVANARHDGGRAPVRRAAVDRPDPVEIRTLTSLAEREKQNVSVRVELGQLHLEHEQAAEAARWYREALALDPGLNDVRADLGAALIRAGQIPEALSEIATVLAKDPTHKGALFNKGFALMQSGDKKGAGAVWKDLLERYPNDPQLDGLRDQMRREDAGAS